MDKPMVTYDHSRLKGKIREICGSDKVFSAKIGRSVAFVSRALSGKATFTFRDIENICETLNIKTDEIPLYFFTRKITEK